MYAEEFERLQTICFTTLVNTIDRNGKLCTWAADFLSIPVELSTQRMPIYWPLAISLAKVV
jgi:hypothetical protein